MVEIHHYKAFGLEIVSELAFPDLPEKQAGAPDVKIRRAAIDVDFGDVGFDWSITREEQVFYWKTLGTYRIRDASIIEIDANEDATPDILSLPLFGVVIATLLHLRGALVLHASAVRIGDGCVVFLGDKGAGKSTTAAAMLDAGHDLLSDDVVAIIADPDGKLAVLPALSHMKLMKDAADRFFPNDDAAKIIHPDVPKKRHKVRTDADMQPVAIKGVYVLDRGQDAQCLQLTGADALSSLIGFTYLSRFGQAAFWPDISIAHLKLCGDLADQAEIARLIVPHGLDRISEATALVGAD